MSLFPRNDDGKIAYTKMWEFKLLKGIIMFFVYILLLSYAAIGFQSAKIWIELRIYADDFNVKNVYAVAEKIAARDDQDLLSHLLFKYPLDYNDELVERLEPLTPQFNASYFFAMATRYYQAGDTNEALFWTMLGRFRMRYDALRCQYETADMVANQYSILSSSADVLRELLNLDAQTRKEILQRVLDWDEQHPPENSPRYYCDFIEDIKSVKNVDIVPRRDWEAIRMIMRGAAMAHISEDSDIIDEQVEEQMP